MATNSLGPTTGTGERIAGATAAFASGSHRSGWTSIAIGASVGEETTDRALIRAAMSTAARIPGQSPRRLPSVTLPSSYTGELAGSGPTLIFTALGSSFFRPGCTP